MKKWYIITFQTYTCNITSHDTVILVLYINNLILYNNYIFSWSMYEKSLLFYGYIIKSLLESILTTAATYCFVLILSNFIINDGWWIKKFHSFNIYLIWTKLRLQLNRILCSWKLLILLRIATYPKYCIKLIWTDKFPLTKYFHWKGYIIH